MLLQNVIFTMMVGNPYNQFPLTGLKKKCGGCPMFICLYYDQKQFWQLYSNFAQNNDGGKVGEN